MVSLCIEHAISLTCSLQVNQLVPSVGEDKLRRLIQQKKFVEAESYALKNGLSVEVHTVLCVCFMIT